jgi:uncharacterized protein with HEPN domain
MQLEILKLYHDILTSINSIDDYLGKKRDYKEFLKNKLLQRGIERELEIIGEAVNRILKLKPDIHIQNARKIVDLRNWVIHGYDRIDLVIIWGVVSKELPLLKEQVEDLITKENNN